MFSQIVNFLIFMGIVCLFLHNYYMHNAVSRKHLQETPYNDLSAYYLLSWWEVKLDIGMYKNVTVCHSFLSYSVITSLKTQGVSWKKFWPKIETFASAH